MPKKFNVTGLCFADEHYMADVSDKIAKTQKMVEEGDYFIINRPRQYGKTTTLYTLAEILEKTGKYLVFNISFEGIGDVVFLDEVKFSPVFLKLLSKRLSKRRANYAESYQILATDVATIDELSDVITDFAESNRQKIVLFIDEVDKSSNNQLFVSFLAMLRNKYLDRRSTKTFHSVVLAGVHDVKSLKLKIRPDEEQKYNSPWNIAADFKVDMSLQPREIKPMLDDYVAEQNVQMDTQQMADQLFYYTSGYPFLVSKLCKIMDEDILPTKETREWTVELLDIAVRQLIGEPNTNFENVTKNLKNNPDLYKFIYKMLIDAELQYYNVLDPIIGQGIMLGILRNGSGVRLHNRIYEEIIYRYMTSQTKIDLDLAEYTINKQFRLPNNVLNMELVLLKFQAFMREQYSKKDRNFVERNGRLIFLAFMKPILNGHGYDFKEAQISEERRLDVIITFYQHQYVAELKIWRGNAAHEEGLEQLADYLDRLALKEGYLIIFDHSETKSWRTERIAYNEKNLFAVWV